MIAWLDIETTGLEPKTGSILELALILTDDSLVELARFESLVAPSFGRGLEVMDSYVVKMHETSGLLKTLYLSAEETDSGTAYSVRDGVPRCGEVETLAIQFMHEAARRPGDAEADTKKSLRTIPLGGNSVHFDRAWIKEHMCDLEKLFSHRNIDCSTLNELAKRWTPEVHAARPGAGGEVAHRAMADVEMSIELAKHYRATLFGSSK